VIVKNIGDEIRRVIKNGIPVISLACLYIIPLQILKIREALVVIITVSELG
jgi:hypothetical protein